MLGRPSSVAHWLHSLQALLASIDMSGLLVHCVPLMLLKSHALTAFVTDPLGLVDVIGLLVHRVP